VKQATAFVSGIGYYTFEMNGALVDATRRLDPGWTPFERTVLYATYDVADQLQVCLHCVDGSQCLCRPQMNHCILIDIDRLVPTVLVFN
jgi:hypothetical protein